MTPGGHFSQEVFFSIFKKVFQELVEKHTSYSTISYANLTVGSTDEIFPFHSTSRLRVSLHPVPLSC